MHTTGELSERRQRTAGLHGQFSIVLIAASAGGLPALRSLLATLPADLDAAVVVLLHRTAHQPQLLGQILARSSALPVSRLASGDALLPRRLYVAPPDFHVVVGSDSRIELTDGRRIRGVLSSANPLFESAARELDGRVIAVVLTGSGYDATDGVQAVHRAGGVVIVQDPATAAHTGMPRNAIDSGAADLVLPLDEIGPAIVSLVRGRTGAR